MRFIILRDTESMKGARQSKNQKKKRLVCAVSRNKFVGGTIRCTSFVSSILVSKPHKGQQHFGLHEHCLTPELCRLMRTRMSRDV